MGNERFIFWFWESSTTGWHACKVKQTRSLYYNMHLFLPYLLNDSQTIFQTPPLCDANLRWLVRLVDYISIKFLINQCLWAVLLCEQRYRRNIYVYLSKSCTYSGKEWISIFIQTNAKITFSQVCARNKWVRAIWMNDAFIKRFIVYCCTPKALYNHMGGLSSPLGWCDGCHRTTAPVRSPHTSYRWRGERVIEPIKWMGIIRRPWLIRARGGNLTRSYRGYTPTLYEKCHGIFNDHRESGTRFKVSSERQYDNISC